MNLRVPVQDVIVVLAVAGAGISPWPWAGLIMAAAYFLGIALLTDRRTPPTEQPTEEPEP